MNNDKKLPFEGLPYSVLWKDYVKNDPKLSSFFTYHPSDESKFVEFANNRSGALQSSSQYYILKAYNESFKLSKKAEEHLNKLANPSTLTITTGQQLGLLGGPLFTLYKIITTIQLAEKYSKTLCRDVVPVFWMADEDHDFLEIAKVVYPDHDRVSSKGIVQPESPQSVARLTITESDILNISSILKQLPESDFSTQVAKNLLEYYSVGVTHKAAFGQFILDLFKEYGLILAGSDHPEVKRSTFPVVEHYINEVEKVHHSIEEQSIALEQVYYRQVASESSFLFAHTQQGRIKINREGDIWSLSSKQYSSQSLIAAIQKGEVDWSPNVFLRPVVQEFLLPNIAYVAGPGELAYYGQMKSFFAVMNREMPLIYPRSTATILDRNAQNYLPELGFHAHDFFQSPENLKKEYIQRKESINFERWYSDWANQLSEVMTQYQKQVSEIDPTLLPSLKSMEAKTKNELQSLLKKTMRSAKKDHDIDMRRIDVASVLLFPQMKLQERTFSFVYFLMKYGVGFIDNLMSQIDALDFQHHTVVHS